MQKGNALFLVLIGVALFAALAYAVTQSGRSGAGSISKEQATIYAAQITQMATAVQQGVMRMTLAGTAASSITAGTPATGAYPGGGTLNGGTNFCTTGATCIFAPDGGGVLLPTPPQAAYIPGGYTGFGSNFAGAGSYNGVIIDGLRTGGAIGAVTGVGTAAPDDMLQFYGLKQEVCQAINTGLGISGIPTIAGGANFPVTSGQMAGCVYMTYGSGFYIYYHVVNAN
jgi:hypothetical protein